jgi:hypothetical protein
MSGLLDTADLKMIPLLEMLLHISTNFYPLMFCQLPVSKAGNIPEKQVMARMRKLISQLLILLSNLVELKNYALNPVLSVLLKKPYLIWSCVEKLR